MRIALFGKNVQKEDMPYMQTLLNQIAEKSDSILIYEDFFNEIHNYITLPKDCTLKLFSSRSPEDLQSDILFSLGGDGTLLDTLSFCKGKDTAVLGINFGHLGFLTSVGREDCEGLLDNLENGHFKTEEHSLLKAESNGLSEIKYAINEICVRRHSPSALLETEVFVNGEYLSTYSSDGLILATPTGSTAYSMSCGGPIISPQSKCLCLTPIAPHNLTHRPLIIPEDSKIEFCISHSESCISLHSDSQNHILRSPAKITISKADFVLKLVRMENQTFFSAIRNKLMWGTNLRNAKKND